MRICDSLETCPGGIAYGHGTIGEPERDVSAGFVDRDDHGVLVGVGVGTVPGFVGGDCGGGEGWRDGGGRILRRRFAYYGQNTIIKYSI